MPVATVLVQSLAAGVRNRGPSGKPPDVPLRRLRGAGGGLPAVRPWQPLLLEGVSGCGQEEGGPNGRQELPGDAEGSDGQRQPAAP